MPNGGIKPSCFVCKWARKDLSEQTHTKDSNPLIGPIEFQLHGFTVWLPADHFCANLGDPKDNSGISRFVEQAGIEAGSVYA
jgi:hypothetical protein